MKNRDIKPLIIFIALATCVTAFSGVKWVDIGVNGLTCSLCTRSVEMRLMRLGFIDSVSMSLEKTEGRVYFRSNEPIFLNEIAKAVVDAGFSIRFVRLEFNFDDVNVEADGSFTFQGKNFLWLDYPGLAKGNVSLKLVDEAFLPRKESSSWKKKIESTKTSGQRVYHVVKD